VTVQLSTTIVVLSVKIILMNDLLWDILVDNFLEFVLVTNCNRTVL
jgi:hypothetical protein